MSAIGGGCRWVGFWAIVFVLVILACAVQPVLLLR